MKIFKYEITSIFVTSVFSIMGVLFVIILGSYNVKDLTEAKKAEKTLENLRELRVALGKYYQITKKYPDLSLDGAKDNLRLLDFKNSKGEVISFAEIYGKESLPNTLAGDGVTETNIVYDISDFSKGSNTGGWNYNFSGNTGEIHPNLPENIYSQGIEWNNY